MAEDRSSTRALKGRLADVYVDALVRGSTESLSKRLGNRATIDDPLFGRASTLTSIDPLLAKAAAWFAERNASYRLIASTTGVDRDVCEGVVTMSSNGRSHELPMALV